MSKDGMSQQECRKYLAAFADGELDVEQNLKVLEQMAMDPTNTRRVLHQQQLRKACAKAMDRADCCCPNELRAKIRAMAARPQVSESASNQAANEGVYTGPPVIARLGSRVGRWIPAAVAAVLLLGTLVAVYQNRFTTSLGGSAALAWADPGLVSINQAGMFQSRHKACSMDMNKLHAAIETPKDITELPGTIDDYFGDVAGRIGSSLDLSVLGYEYQRVGDCTIPGKGAVQVLYKSKDSDNPKSLSLWIKPAAAGPELAPGRLYTAAETRDGRPLMMWTAEGRTYYLVGDSAEDCERAAEVIATGAGAK